MSKQSQASAGKYFRTGFRFSSGPGTTKKTTTVTTRGRSPRTKRRKAMIYKQPFPQKRFVRFKWTAYGTLTTTAALVATNVFRLNSLFDPDTTGGSNTKPKYFDQLCTNLLYSTYRVDSVDYEIKLHNEAETDAVITWSVRDKIVGAPVSAIANYQSGDRIRTRRIIIGEKGEGDQGTATLRGHQACWPVVASSKNEYESSAQFQVNYNASPDSTDSTVTATLAASALPQNSDGVTVLYFVTFWMNAVIFDNVGVPGDS